MCNDILQVAFNRKFINEIFTHHQPIYSKKVLKAMFERLAHASTIRVTPESLDKVSFLFYNGCSKYGLISESGSRWIKSRRLFSLDG